MLVQRLLKEIEDALERNRQAALEYTDPKRWRDFGHDDPDTLERRAKIGRHIANQGLKELDADGTVWAALLEYVRGLEAKVSALDEPILSYQHLKTGNTYEFLHHATLEKDGSYVVVYREMAGRRMVWVRSADEFFDGRFVLELPNA